MNQLILAIYNYILNNPNLFFAETDILKNERNIMKKRNQKKDLIKTLMSPMVTFSPSNHTRKSKVIFGRNSHTKLLDKKIKMRKFW